MDPDILKKEQANADETLDYLRQELAKETAILTGRRDSLKEINKIMSSDYFGIRSGDTERLSEIAQYLAQFNQEARAAEFVAAIISKYERLLNAPYFGRFDILEQGTDYAEKIYVGFHNLFDLSRGKVYIYDWRSPIAGIYYRFELGKCHYDAPDGRVEGEVLIKRQLKFYGGELKFYADSGLVIRDEILLETLSQNATPKMKTIVETIQKEQDQIIRDLSSGALMVNGVAGSGKTAIALHRIAYLLYETKTTGVTHKNILSLSPSDAFADYVDDVLPNLGEERIQQLTIDGIYANCIKGIRIQTKNQYLESMAVAEPSVQKIRLKAMAFKSSRTMAEILDRAAWLYERRIHEFSDIFLNGRLLYTREQLKALFLDNKAKLSVKARLLRIRDAVTAKAEPFFKEIREKLNKIVKTHDKWTFEEEARTEFLLAKIKNRFFAALNKQTRVDPVRLYLSLGSSRNILHRLSLGLNLPEDAYRLLTFGRRQILRGFLPFGDAGAVLHLTERLCGIKDYIGFRHVIIDEAQDYGLVNFLTFKRIFPNARYTVLGDVNQAVGHRIPLDFFRRINHTMSIPKTVLLSLRKSYRSSTEIQEFCNQLLGRADQSEKLSQEAFNRKGRPPQIISGSRPELISCINEALETGSPNTLTAILTKTATEAKNLSASLPYFNKTENKALITAANEKLSKHLNIMPAYMAKGLEFDTVMIWETDANDNKKSPVSRALLYVACTRALHELNIYKIVGQ